MIRGLTSATRSTALRREHAGGHCITATLRSEGISSSAVVDAATRRPVSSHIDIHSAHRLAAPAKWPTASGTARIVSTVKMPSAICAIDEHRGDQREVPQRRPRPGAARDDHGRADRRRSRRPRRSRDGSCAGAGRPPRATTPRSSCTIGMPRQTIAAPRWRTSAPSKSWTNTAPHGDRDPGPGIAQLLAQSSGAAAARPRSARAGCGTPCRSAWRSSSSRAARCPVDTNHGSLYLTVIAPRAPWAITRPSSSHARPRRFGRRRISRIVSAICKRPTVIAASRWPCS